MMNSPYYRNFVAGGGMNPPKKPTRTSAVGNRDVGKGKAKQAGLPVVPLTPKEMKKIERQRRREKDYFFVMRKGVCFFLFLFFLLTLVLSAVGVVTKFVNLPASVSGYVEQYTNIYKVPDNTPTDERPEGYADTTSYVSGGDLLFGALKSIAAMPFLDNSDGTSSSPFFDSVKEFLAGVDPAADGMAPIQSILFAYSPLLLAVCVLTSLIAMITSFLGLFGKRIFKGFGLAAILVLISAAALLISGLAALPYTMGEAGAGVSTLDFSQLMPYITGLFAAAPETAVDPSVTAAPASITIGYGLLILAGLSVLTLLFSIFARKKIPYSVFDK
jgi:hypothetical protein